MKRLSIAIGVTALGFALSGPAHADSRLSNWMTAGARSGGTEVLPQALPHGALDGQKLRLDFLIGSQRRRRSARLVHKESVGS